MALEQNTQNVVALGGLAALLLIILNAKPDHQFAAMAHGYSVAPYASTSACIPCGQNPGFRS